MAEAGALMTNFYAIAPVCGPSRSTLLYGQHTGHAPIRSNPKWTVDAESPVMRADSTLLPKELKRARYTTAVFGKWGMNEVITDAATGDGEGHPFRQGFDEFVGFNTHRSSFSLARLCLGWAEKDRPKQGNQGRQLA